MWLTEWPIDNEAEFCTDLFDRRLPLCNTISLSELFSRAYSAVYSVSKLCGKAVEE